MIEEYQYIVPYYYYYLGLLNTFIFSFINDDHYYLWYIHYLNICVLLFIFFIQCLLNLGGRKINEDFYNLDYPVKKGSVRITTR